MKPRPPGYLLGGLILIVTIVAPACSAGDAPPTADSEIVFVLHPSTWFEHAWSYYEVAPSGDRALYGARFGFQLIDLRPGRGESTSVENLDDRVSMAYFLPEDRLMLFRTMDGEPAWFAEGSPEPEMIPASAVARRSPDGRTSAYFDEANRDLVLVDYEAVPRQTRHEVAGFIAGLSWAPNGSRVYALVWMEDGTSAVLAVSLGDESPEILFDQLDTVWRFGAIAVSPGGGALYLALAGAGPPEAEARHRPGPSRDLDIYRLDLVSHAIDPVVEIPGDDFNPQIIGEYLYWTHNVIADSVVAFPATGGDSWLVAEDAEIPTWRPDGSRIGLTYGGWRLADWGLNLDAGVIEVDENARPVSEITPIVVGYHEDFSPVWSPNGRWIAYHSHRSEEPGSYYSDEGSTDSIYVRRPDAPAESEVSLFDFGWEVGNPDWSLDGRQLVFESWDRDTPGVSWSWIATINPETGETLGIERLPLPQGVDHVSWSAWSPDGEEIAIVEWLEGTGRRIWTINARTGEGETLIEFDASTYGGIDWTPDGERLVFGALAGDRMQIFSVPRSGGEPTQLTADSADLMHPQVSPDGRFIACTRMDQAKELRRTPLR